jgi:acetyl-CoA carboxylase biotin carboxylase subunit
VEAIPTFTGTINRIFVPGGFGVRFDSHVHAGYRVPPYYDSMIGKLLVHQPTRDEGIDSMIRALSELRIEGIATTADFHRVILSDVDFRAGRVDTKWVERTEFSRTVG